MLDINKAVNDRELQGHDPDGHMYGLETWSTEIARSRARQEGLGELSDAQWVVIHTLRGLHRRNGRAAGSREISAILERDFAAEGGRRYLYELFPGGPVNQGSRLAGIPTPPYASDPSFGSTS